MDQNPRKPIIADEATIDQLMAFADHLLDKLASTVPVAKTDDPKDHAGRRVIARTLFNAMQPHDEMQALLAAKAVAAYLASMDMFARAAQPEVSDTSAIRLRNSALAASRSFDNTLRSLHNVAPPASVAAPVRPEPKPQPTHAPRNQPPSTPLVKRPDQAVSPSQPIITRPPEEPTFAQSVRTQALSSVARVMAFASSADRAR